MQHQRAAVLEANEEGPSRPTERGGVVVRPQHGLQRLHGRLSSFGWQRLHLSSLLSKKVPIGGWIKPFEPGGSFFGLDPVKDSDRGRDVPYEIVIRHFV